MIEQYLYYIGSIDGAIVMPSRKSVTNAPSAVPNLANHIIPSLLEDMILWPTFMFSKSRPNM